MSVNANVTCANRIWVTSITAANTTKAKILVDHTPGGLALPDNGLFTSEMPQVTRGGQRIIGGSVSSTDATSKDFTLYRGTTLTTQAGGTTGALAVATTSTVTRASGDFRADGWTVGDAMMIFGAGPTALGGVGTPDVSNNAGAFTALSSAGVLAIVTGVAAATLTVNGTPLTVESLAGCRLVRIAQVSRTTVAGNSGNAAATPHVLLIGNSNELDINNLSAADRGLSLGQNDILAVAAAATLSALPAQLHFNAISVLF